MRTLSAAPTWRTTRRPTQPAGTVKVRSYTPVGLTSGTSGGEAREGHLDVRVVRQVPRALRGPQPGDLDIAPVVARRRRRGAVRSWKRHRAVERKAVRVRDAVHRHSADPGKLGRAPRRRDHASDCRIPGAVEAPSPRGNTTQPSTAAAAARTAPRPNTAACPSDE